MEIIQSKIKKKIDNLQEIEEDDDKISLTKDAAIAALAGFGTYTGYKFVKNLTKDRYNRVADAINNNIDYEKLQSKYKLNEDIENLSAQTFDKLDVLNMDEYDGLISDLSKGIARSDKKATQATMLSLDDSLVIGEHNVAINKLNDALINLGKNTPDRLQKLDDLADAHMRLSNYHNIRDKNNNLVLPQYKEDKLTDLYKAFDNALQAVRNDKELSKLLDDISQADKQLLKAQYKSGDIDKNTYEYLLKNRDIDGVFLYKRGIKPIEKEENDIVDKILYKPDKIKKIKNTINKRTHFDLDLDTEYVPYSQDFYQKYLDYTSLILNNGSTRHILKNIIKNNQDYLRGLSNTPDFVEKFNKFKRLETIKDIEFEKLRNNEPNSYEQAYKDWKKYKNELITDTNNRVRVKYLADIKYDFDVSKIDNAVNIKENPYTLLNLDEKSSNAEKLLVHNKNKITKSDVVDALYDALHNPNSKYIALPNGNNGYALFEAEYYIKKALDVSPEVLSSWEDMVKFSRNMFQHATTGNLNPLFASKSAIYGTFEALSSLPLIFEKNGLKFNTKEYFINLYYQGKAIRDFVKVRFENDIINNIKTQLQNENLDPETINKLTTALDHHKAVLDKMILSKFERQGVFSFGEANLRDLNEEVLSNTTFRRKVKDVYGNVRGNKILNTLSYILDALRNSANNGLALHLSAKLGVEKLSDQAATKIVRKIGRTIAESVTDTKQVGIYESMAGKIAGFISNYPPYGNVMIKSIASKLRNLGISDGINFTKAALKEIKQSDNKILDTIISLQIGSKMLKDNKYIQGLVATVTIPTTICYLWNHSSQENREEYYKLSDYDKAGKLVLVNFFGKGKHLTIPGDQECMVVSKLYETLLDSFIGGSKMQETDPAFKQSSLIMQALSRSLDISNLIYPEAMLNLAGYRSNFGAETLAGEPVIQKLPRNVKNLDGSETAVQDGLLSQEARALMNTIGGALMTSLGNSAEQFNIGTRDVGIKQGIKDAVSSFVDQNLRQLPIASFARSHVYRATNQTSLANKKMRETIDKLKQLISTSKRGDATFGNRKDTNVPNLAQVKPLTPELQSKLALANIIIPEYNKNILPLYDKVGALYKQLNAYNATGRDLNGNVVSTTDRFEFQQKVNIELQDLQKQIYTQYKLLEKMLTEETGHDINLTDIATIQ